MSPPEDKKPQDVMDLDDLLSSADTAAREQQAKASAAALTAEENRAIRDYCRASIKKQKTAEKTKATSKTVRGRASELRGQLEEWMRERHIACAVIPRSVLAERERQFSAKSAPPLPPFVRLVRNNFDRKITTDVLDAAFRSLTREAICEQPVERGKEALVSAFVGAVRGTVRSYKEQCRLYDGLPRGQRLADTPELPPEIGHMAADLHGSVAETKSITKARKEEELGGGSAGSGGGAGDAEGLKSLEPKVKQVLEKLGVTSQQVEVGNEPYRIVRRQSTSKPKVTLNGLRDMLLTQVLADFPETNKEGAAAYWEASRDKLQRSLLMKIAALPATRTDKLHLRRVGGRDGGESKDEESGSGSESQNA